MPSQTPPLAGGVIEVWSVGLERPAAAVAALHATLPADERARAERFRFERDRRRFSVAHAALRAILAARLGCAPGAVALLAGEYGKPALAGNRAGLEFNLSHAAEYALIALALDTPIGVDIEQPRPIVRREWGSRNRESDSGLANQNYRIGKAPWNNSRFPIPSPSAPAARRPARSAARDRRWRRSGRTRWPARR
ncbi:MAG TPA: hypothetical protein VD886_26475 [Herpetosiphonaceae bacterium]|nr:hypothetical protein [Herpetosiphonaceae bacterium]